MPTERDLYRRLDRMENSETVEEWVDRYMEESDQRFTFVAEDADPEDVADAADPVLVRSAGNADYLIEVWTDRSEVPEWIDIAEDLPA
jgi:hypothetical protein